MFVYTKDLIRGAAKCGGQELDPWTMYNPAKIARLQGQPYQDALLLGGLRCRHEDYINKED